MTEAGSMGHSPEDYEMTANRKRKQRARQVASDSGLPYTAALRAVAAEADGDQHDDSAQWAGPATAPPGAGPYELTISGEIVSARPGAGAFIRKTQAGHSAAMAPVVDLDWQGNASSAWIPLMRTRRGGTGKTVTVMSGGWLHVDGYPDSDDGEPREALDAEEARRVLMRLVQQAEGAYDPIIIDAPPASRDWPRYDFLGPDPQRGQPGEALALHPPFAQFRVLGPGWWDEAAAHLRSVLTDLTHEKSSAPDAQRQPPGPALASGD